MRAGLWGMGSRQNLRQASGSPTAAEPNQDFKFFRRWLGHRDRQSGDRRKAVSATHAGVAFAVGNQGFARRNRHAIARPVDVIVKAVRNVHQCGTIKAQSVSARDLEAGIVLGDDRIFFGGIAKFPGVTYAARNHGIGKNGAAGFWSFRGGKVHRRLPVGLQRGEGSESTGGRAGARMTDREECN